MENNLKQCIPAKESDGSFKKYGAYDEESGKSDTVNHPSHYKGKDNPYEAIKVIDAWELGFCLGNAVKYIARAGHKIDRIEDLKKAIWYIQHEIDKNDLLSNNESGTL